MQVIEIAFENWFRRLRISTGRGVARVQGKRSKLPRAPPLRGAKSRSLKKLDLSFAMSIILT